MILVVSSVMYATTETLYIYGTQRASRTINVQLIDSILRATFRYVIFLSGQISFEERS